LHIFSVIIGIDNKEGGRAKDEQFKFHSYIKDILFLPYY
jgi:hypothetical protein